MMSCRTRKIKPINHYLAVLLAMLWTGEKCMTSWKEKLSDTLRLSYGGSGNETSKAHVST